MGLIPDDFFKPRTKEDERRYKLKRRKQEPVSTGEVPKHIPLDNGDRDYERDETEDQ